MYILSIHERKLWLELEYYVTVTYALKTNTDVQDEKLTAITFNTHRFILGLIIVKIVSIMLKIIGENAY